MKINTVQYAEELITKHGAENALSIAKGSYEGAKLGTAQSSLPSSKDLNHYRIRNSAEWDRLRAKEFKDAESTVNFWNHVYSIIWKRVRPEEKRPDLEASRTSA